MLDVQATEDLQTKLIGLWEDQTVVTAEHKVKYIWNHVDCVILMGYNGNIIVDECPEVILQRYVHLLSEYGTWHPHAQEFVPSRVDFSTTNSHLLQFKNGCIIRGKSILLSFPDLEIGLGEWITITGANGSGETTLPESITQLIKYQGDAYFENQRLTKIKHAAKHMYLVYQNPELQFITNSVYDETNIHFNHLFKDQSDDETIQLLKFLDLQNVKDQHPYELSIDQKRRLGAATTLSSKADIIFLDKPTFRLDSHNTLQLTKFFQERTNLGRGVVMVTHDDEIIERYLSRRLKILGGALLDCDSDVSV